MTTSAIMLVDDEVSFVEAISKRMGKRGMEPVSAFSGEECLELLKSNEHIDVIILDVKMPGMGGIETLKIVKQKYPLIEVIMLTGHATMETAIEGIKMGAYDYLMKPCEMDELLHKVNSAAKKKQTHEKKVHDWARFMESGSLKELMVPIDEYATVSENANVFEAISALEEAQNSFNPERYRHRAILVLDEEKRVVGKLNQHDIIQALEPQYKKSKERSERVLGHFGFGQTFIESVSSHYSMWDNPLQDIYKKTFEQNVKSFMHVPTEAEYIEDSASMNDAIHRLIIGKHQSLLVTGGSGVVGVLRLTDVFELLHLRLKALHLAAKIGEKSDGEKTSLEEGG
ncbi:MAG: response regulator [Desulfobacterales bacterium]|nr:response regulator [Desulfobacterales bacterium]